MIGDTFNRSTLFEFKRSTLLQRLISAPSNFNVRQFVACGLSADDVTYINGLRNGTYSCTGGSVFGGNPLYTSTSWSNVSSVASFLNNLDFDHPPIAWADPLTTNPADDPSGHSWAYDLAPQCNGPKGHFYSLQYDYRDDGVSAIGTLPVNWKSAATDVWDAGLDGIDPVGRMCQYKFGYAPWDSHGTWPVLYSGVTIFEGCSWYNVCPGSTTPGGGPFFYEPCKIIGSRTRIYGLRQVCVVRVDVAWPGTSISNFTFSGCTIATPGPGGFIEIGTFSSCPTPTLPISVGAGAFSFSGWAAYLPCTLPNPPGAFHILTQCSC